jgi:hypothetical protein
MRRRRIAAFSSPTYANDDGAICVSASGTSLAKPVNIFLTSTPVTVRINNPVYRVQVTLIPCSNEKIIDGID